jgi:sodium-dependent phosphate cotransporter
MISVKSYQMRNEDVGVRAVARRTDAGSLVLELEIIIGKARRSVCGLVGLAIGWFSVLFLIYLFFLSISLLGVSLKMLGGGILTELLSLTSNPLVGLFVGILATSMLQSSSSVTSLTVGLVAAGGLNVAQAVPIIMGSNMGTSVTNALVAAGQISKPEEFRRAFAAAVVDDFFEICCIAILLPLQLAFNVLGASAAFVSKQFAQIGGLHTFDPLNALIDPVIELIIDLVYFASPLVLLVLALALLFLSLSYLVKLLKRHLIGRIERFFDKVLFKTAGRAMALGFASTALLQSSSMTTSLAVPLAGAGFLKLHQVFSYALGANVGTTLTAIFAALVTGQEAAVTVAFAHLLYNVIGIALVWPIRRIPLGLAELLAKYALRSRLIPLGYVILVFFAIPMALIFSIG